MRIRTLHVAGTPLVLLAVLGCAHEITKPPIPEATLLPTREIFSIPLVWDGNGQAGILTALTLSLSIRPGGYADTGAAPRYALFGQDTIRGGDKGQTLVASADNSPSFRAFVELLTDGTDEQVDLDLERARLETSESHFFGRTPDEGPDFAGYVIDRIEFRIDSVLIIPPGRDPNRDLIWTSYDLEGRLVLLGHPSLLRHAQ